MSRPKRRSKGRWVPAIGCPSKRSPLPVIGGRSEHLPAVRRPSWKLLGLAGIAGVAATGVVVARNRRAHSDLPPEELRDRLRERLVAVDAPGEPDGAKVAPD